MAGADAGHYVSGAQRF